jgi:hypothetical protein
VVVDLTARGPLAVVALAALGVAGLGGVRAAAVRLCTAGAAVGCFTGLIFGA